MPSAMLSAKRFERSALRVKQSVGAAADLRDLVRMDAIRVLVVCEWCLHANSTLGAEV